MGTKTTTQWFLKQIVQGKQTKTVDLISNWGISYLYMYVRLDTNDFQVETELKMFKMTPQF